MKRSDMTPERAQACRDAVSRYYQKNKDKIKQKAKERIAQSDRKRDYSAEIAKASALRRTDKGWKRVALNHARYRAKKKNIPFCLTVEDIKLTEYCPVLGIKFQIGRGADPRRNYASPTLDRIDNEKGYIRGNVRVISQRANSLKSNATIGEIEAVLRYMKEEALLDQTPKIVHINRHMLAANTKDGGQRPIVSVKHKGTVRYAREVEFLGPCKLRYDGTALSCGARTWIETTAEISLTDEMNYQEAKKPS